MRFLKYHIVLVLLCFFNNVNASHIVGGEIQMLHQRGENYLLRLILYYDKANAEFNLIDKEIDLGIFRKVNDSKVEKAKLDFKQYSDIKYANPNCLPDSLKTIQVIYESQFRFNTSKYTHPEGYYVSWERCCRNNIISNIFEPGRQGMVFKLDFPSMVDYPGNSSPTFNQIQGEYICLNRYISLDFGARDTNGDSLSYHLDVPMAGFTSPDNPQGNLTAGPYPYVDNYFLMPGSPYLNINEKTGFLSVRPSQRGLYVFRVVCIEYRNGNEIGRINRDFQILVDECKDTFRPEVIIKNHNNQIYNEGDTLFISGKNDLCYDLIVKDKDEIDLINFEISPINFDDKDAIFSPSSALINSGIDSAIVKMCWPDCTNPEDQEVFEFYLIVSDNSCPVQNYDSIKVILKVKEEGNTRPEIQIDLNEVNWSINNPFYMNVFAWDDDVNDTLNISVKSQNENFNYNLRKENIGNPVDGVFSFTAVCENIDQNPIKLIFKVADNSCASNRSDSIEFTVNVTEFLETEIPDLRPANVITPNGDGFNDFFSFNFSVPNLCEFQNFQKVVIYNRWGINIYESEEIEFRWDAENLTSGQYFYQIQFENKSIKGFIHVIK